MGYKKGIILLIIILEVIAIGQHFSPCVKNVYFGMAFLFFRQKFDLSDTEFAKSIHFPSCLESVNWVLTSFKK
jgi:hypothetical protein